MRIFIILFHIFVLCFSDIVLAEDKKETEPNVKAYAAILMDYKTGRVLWEKDSSKPLAMASTTKIMTAITAIESGKIEEIVKVSKKAAITPPVKMNLSEGEEIKLKDLLYALMMQSSNDAAVAIAEHVGGSVEKFCEDMTKKAAEIGAKDTVFRTPNGLDLGEHHSTAYDMAVIARYALNNDTFLEIINTKNISFKSSKSSYSVINKNRLLNEFEGAIGVKTGYTGKAGHCFVGAAQRNDMRLISVVLASGWGNTGKEQKWIDTKKILNYGFNNFSYQNAVNKDDLIDNISVDRARVDSVKLYSSDDFIVPININKNEKIDIKVNKPDIIKAPVYNGQIIGKADIFIDGIKYGSVDLKSKDNIQRHDLKTSFKKILNYWLKLSY